MKVTTIVFKSEEDRQEYVKMQAEYLNLPSAVVQYTFEVYTADPKRGDPADNGKPTIEVTDYADELSYKELTQIMSFEAYINTRHHFDYQGRKLVDFTRTKRQAKTLTLTIPRTSTIEDAKYWLDRARQLCPGREIVPKFK